MTSNNEKLSFRVSSGLKNIIGRDLISDKYIAIFELVKNSYDAQSHNVSISFSETTESILSAEIFMYDFVLLMFCTTV